MGGHTEIVRLILERATNTPVDHVRTLGTTALMGSALYHHAGTLRLLADRGANVNVVVGQQRGTPLHLVVGQINPEDFQQRDPDPDGARRLATVRALLRLGAGTLPPPHPPPPAPPFLV